MQIIKDVVGIVNTNFYVVYDNYTNETVLIDPGEISQRVDNIINSLGRENVSYILLTHGHFDHIKAAAYYKNITGAKIVMSEKEVQFINNGFLNLSYNNPRAKVLPFTADELLNDGDELPFCDTLIKMISTPGHTQGSCCYLLDKKLFTGDTIMEFSIGRTDFPTGNKKSMKKSILKLMAFKENYIIYPGHGNTTNLTKEQQNNTFFNII